MINGIVRRKEITVDNKPDIDADRLIDIFESAVASINDILRNPNFGKTLEGSRKIISSVLEFRAAPLTLVLPMYNNVVNDLYLVLNMQKRTIKSVSHQNPKKAALINSALIRR